MNLFIFIITQKMRTPELLSLFDQYMRMYANCKKNGGKRMGRGSEEKENQEEKQRTCKKEKEYFCCYYMVDLERSIISIHIFIIICLFSGAFDI